MGVGTSKSRINARSIHSRFKELLSQHPAERSWTEVLVQLVVKSLRAMSLSHQYLNMSRELHNETFISVTLLNLTRIFFWFLCTLSRIMRTCAVLTMVDVKRGVSLSIKGVALGRQRSRSPVQRNYSQTREELLFHLEDLLLAERGVALPPSQGALLPSQGALLPRGVPLRIQRSCSRRLEKS